jgi:polyhydroxyalkanoate synthase
MASAFRLLRSNSLIWHYVVHGWLYGETPPPFDVLYWNMDTTRMPYAMHAWYLRELYLHNRLIDKDALTVAGEPIDLGRITQPVYAVGAEDDHIAPWRQTFRTLNHVSGPKRFVLSSSGHILGIVNPPVDPPKRRFWVGPARRTDTAEGWQAVPWSRPGAGGLTGWRGSSPSAAARRRAAGGDRGVSGWPMRRAPTCWSVEPVPEAGVSPAV